MIWSCRLQNILFDRSSKTDGKLWQEIWIKQNLTVYTGLKPHLLTTYHTGGAYIIYCIWPLLTFDLHEGHSHPKLASAALLTKFGSYRELFIIMTLADLSPLWRS